MVPTFTLELRYGVFRAAETWLQRGACDASAASSSRLAVEVMGSGARRTGLCVSTAWRCPAGGVAQLPVLSSVDIWVVFSFFLFLDEQCCHDQSGVLW